MPKEPTFPKRDLSQAAVDAIATRIDAYEQSWQKRWEESDRRWEERMQRLETLVERTAEGIEEIRSFLGTAAEEQRAARLRLETLEEKVDRRFDALTTTLEGQQALANRQAETVQELIKLVTVMSSKAA